LEQLKDRPLRDLLDHIPSGMKAAGFDPATLDPAFLKSLMKSTPALREFVNDLQAKQEKKIRLNQADIDALKNWQDQAKGTKPSKPDVLNSADPAKTAPDLAAPVEPSKPLSDRF